MKRPRRPHLPLQRWRVVRPLVLSGIGEASSPPVWTSSTWQPPSAALHSGLTLFAFFDSLSRSLGRRESSVLHAMLSRQGHREQPLLYLRIRPGNPLLFPLLSRHPSSFLFEDDLLLARSVLIVLVLVLVTLLLPLSLPLPLLEFLANLSVQPLLFRSYTACPCYHARVPHRPHRLSSANVVFLLPRCSSASWISFYRPAGQPDWLGHHRRRFLPLPGNSRVSISVHLRFETTEHVTTFAIFACTYAVHRIKAGAAHIAFSADSRTAVRDFYTAALTAGGRPHGSPACRNEDNGYFNAAVLDFDGNSVEVVFREGLEEEAGSVAGRSRVLEWRGSVTESLNGDARSIVSVRSAAKTVKALTYAAPSIAPSMQKSHSTESVETIPRPSAARSVSTPVVATTVATERRPSSDGNAKTIIGTLLGAAAGAAVAYAMCKGEADSAREEADAYAQHAKRLMAAPPPAPASENPQQAAYPYQHQQIEYQDPPRTIHRNFSATESIYSTPSHHGALRAIEAPPSRSYQSPTYTSIAPSQARTDFDEAIEYIPAASVVSGSRAPTERSRGPPTFITSPKSAAGRSSHSTLISEFRPPTEVPRAAAVDDSARSVASSHRSSRSKAESKAETKAESKAPSKAPSSIASLPRSTHSLSSKHTSASKKSKAPSIVGSILGRDAIVEELAIVTAAPAPSTIIEDLNLDTMTVVPEDSISCVGSSRSRRSHHSSSHSHHSSRKGSSRHSSHSHLSRRDSAHDDTPADESSDTDPAAYEEARSHHSHRSSRSHHSKSSKHSRVSAARSKTAGDDADMIRPSSIEEAGSDASTIKPSRRGSSDSRKGSVASLPIRAITKSMVEGVTGRKSVASYAG